MTQTVCVLGRQPKIGLAELESLFGADKIQPVGDEAAIIDLDPSTIDFSRLGGTMKFAKLLTFIDGTNWSTIHNFLISAVPQHIQYLPQGKLRLGLSVYGLKVTPEKILATGLEVKKVLKLLGRPMRLVPNKIIALNSAQVLYNQLTSALGWELLFIKDGERIVCAQSIAVQDIDAYADRDQGRPKRDARVGMLPPKLAQIIINLATGKIENPVTKLCLLDPFCGTGVILQEALLMGYDVYGTDIETKMIEYATENLNWLRQTTVYKDKCGPNDNASPNIKLEIADALTKQWPKFDIVATETYLGRPLSAPPNEDTIQQITTNVDHIIKKFISNLAVQTKPGFRACLALPAWFVKNRFQHLKLLDSLEELGYTRLSFVHATKDDLIYHRPDQFVARELVVIIRK